MGLFEMFTKIEEDVVEGILDGAEVVWSKASWERVSEYAFVIYSADGDYVDSLDPVEAVYMDEDNIYIYIYIYIEHYYSSVGLNKVSIGDMRNKGYTCRVEKEHYHYQCDESVIIDILEW